MFQTTSLNEQLTESNKMYLKCLIAVVKLLFSVEFPIRLHQGILTTTTNKQKWLPILIIIFRKIIILLELITPQYSFQLAVLLVK